MDNLLTFIFCAANSSIGEPETIFISEAPKKKKKNSTQRGKKGAISRKEIDGKALLLHLGGPDILQTASFLERHTCATR